jgi:uncharacterized membrane protein
VLVLALAVRLIGLNAESFSMDEITDLEFARLPAGRLVFLADGFPPLYHLSLKLWLLLWGTPLAARWLGALLGVVTVYAVYRLAERAAGPRAAAAAGALAAISPLHVWFSQESRGYALALPLAALALWRFYEAARSNLMRDWLIYALVAALAVGTHYFTGILLALQGLWVLPSLKSRRLGPPLAAYGMLALAAIPVYLVLRQDLGYQSGTGDGTVGLGELLYPPYVFLLGFSTGPSLRELHDLGFRGALRSALPWVLAALVFLAPALVAWVRRSRLDRATIGYLLLTAVGPVAVTAIVSDLFAFKYKVSYVSWGSLPLLVLLGDAVASAWESRLARYATAGYAALLILALANRHLQDRYRTEDLRSAAAYLEAHAAPAAPIVVVPWYMADPLRFYLGSRRAVTEAPKIAPAAPVGELLRAPLAEESWVVYTRSFDGDPGGEIKSRLADAPRARLAASFAGVELYRIGGAPARTGP